MKTTNVIIGMLGVGAILLGYYSTAGISFAGVNTSDKLFSAKFVSKLDKCLPYTETTKAAIGNITLTNKIVGKQDGKCQVILYGNTTCNFNNEQIKEIADSYKGSGTNSYSSGSASVTTTDPLSATLGKLLNNPAVCTSN